MYHAWGRMWMMKLNVFSDNLRQRAAQIAAGWLELEDAEQQLDDQLTQLGFFQCVKRPYKGDVKAYTKAQQAA